MIGGWSLPVNSTPVIDFHSALFFVMVVSAPETG